MSAENEYFSNINSSDSILSSGVMDEPEESEPFESNQANTDSHKSLENIFLDGPSYVTEGDTSSMASCNDSLINFQMFEDDNNADVEKVNNDVTSDERRVLTTPNEIKFDIPNEESTDVGFEQPKIMKPLSNVSSSKSLMKFFTDSPTGKGEDMEGKNFFDSFTTQDDEGLIRKSDEQINIPSPTETSQTSPPIDPVNSLVETVDRKLEDDKDDRIDVPDQNVMSSNFERSVNAWLPSDKTKQSLLTVLYNGPNVIVPFPTSELTMPGVIIEESLGDPIRASILKHIGEQEADKRFTLNVDSVPQDPVGLQQLIKADCLRAAVDLTCRLLTSCGQGAGKMNQLSTHTPMSLQLWFCRLSLLARLNLYGPAECEWQPFAGLDNPDLYYEFHQSKYPGKRGSMVPFEMRVLHAEFPQHLQRHQESLDRLYSMLFVINRIVKNLKTGLLEDGSKGALSEKERNECLSLWEQRDRRVLYCIANCLLKMKDHSNSLKILRQLLTKDPTHQHELHSVMGRIYLQVGDVERAKNEFSKLTPSQFKSQKDFDTQKLLNEGFIELGSSEFSKAMQSFRKVYEVDRQNILALNNMCVCSLYLEKLKESLKQLELLIYTTPKLYLQEILVLNLCTMYELESSKANIKKQNLLRLIGQHKGTGFNASCLKLT